MTSAKPKYDPFFSTSLEIPAIAHCFFQQHIPKHLVDHQFDLEYLIRMDRVNTDPKLKRRARDIIYKTTLNKVNTAFLCVEHQSQHQWKLPLRLLQYHVDTIRTHLNAGNRKWPLVLSLVFYLGQRSPYPYSSQSTDYYEDPILGKQQLYFRFYIIDITQVSDQEILQHGICAPMELLLKHGRDGKFELAIEDYRNVFYRCIAAAGDEYIFSMLSYAKDVSDIAVGEKLYKFIEQVFTDKQELIMTYGQKLKYEGKLEGIEIGILRCVQQGMQQGVQQGMQQGMQQGIQQEKLTLAKIMLQEGEPIEKIMKWTGLSRQTIEAYKASM